MGDGGDTHRKISKPSGLKAVWGQRQRCGIGDGTRTDRASALDEPTTHLDVWYRQILQLVRRPNENMGLPLSWCCMISIRHCIIAMRYLVMKAWKND